MYREHKNPVFDFVQRRGRERHNADATAIEREDIRAMLKVLRAGRAIWYAPDQDYGPKQSIFVPLFGIQAATVTATTKFARLGKARVVPFTQERLADGCGYRLVIHPPLADFPGESEEADCLRINQWIEQAVTPASRAVPVGTSALQDPSRGRAQAVPQARDGSRALYSLEKERKAPHDRSSRSCQARHRADPVGRRGAGGLSGGRAGGDRRLARRILS